MARSQTNSPRTPNSLHSPRWQHLSPIHRSQSGPPATTAGLISSPLGNPNPLPRLQLHGLSSGTSSRCSSPGSAAGYDPLGSLSVVSPRLKELLAQATTQNHARSDGECLVHIAPAPHFECPEQLVMSPTQTAFSPSDSQAKHEVGLHVLVNQNEPISQLQATSPHAHTHARQQPAASPRQPQPEAGGQSYQRVAQMSVQQRSRSKLATPAKPQLPVVEDATPGTLENAHLRPAAVPFNEAAASGSGIDDASHIHSAVKVAGTGALASSFMPSPSATATEHAQAAVLPAVQKAVRFKPQPSRSTSGRAAPAAAGTAQHTQRPPTASTKSTSSKTTTKRVNTRQHEHKTHKQHNRQQFSWHGVDVLDDGEEETIMSSVQQQMMATIQSSAADDTASMVSGPDAPMTSLRQHHVHTASPCDVQAGFTASQSQMHAPSSSSAGEDSCSMLSAEASDMSAFQQLHASTPNTAVDAPCSLQSAQALDMSAFQQLHATTPTRTSDALCSLQSAEAPNILAWQQLHAALPTRQPASQASGLAAGEDTESILLQPLPVTQFPTDATNMQNIPASHRVKAPPDADDKYHTDNSDHTLEHQALSAGISILEPEVALSALHGIADGDQHRLQFEYPRYMVPESVSLALAHEGQDDTAYGQPAQAVMAGTEQHMQPHAANDSTQHVLSLPVEQLVAPVCTTTTSADSSMEADSTAGEVKDATAATAVDPDTQNSQLAADIGPAEAVDEPAMSASSNIFNPLFMDRCVHPNATRLVASL